jgi:DNA-binding response OmpR family regulator
MLATSQKLLAHPQASEIITILAITPYEDDHQTLQMIFNHRNWRLQTARTYAEGRRILRESRAAVVICERDLPDGNWKDVLYELALMENAPQLIVVSRLADDHLWAEVLNLGGYDVLQKPFDPNEVMRAVSMAWRHFRGTTPAPSLLPPPPDSPFDPHSFPVTYSSN